MSTQTAIYRCDVCEENFKPDFEFQQHQEHSPFHGPKFLDCHECNTKFNTQIALLTHIDSKPHKARWVLALI